MKDVFPGFKIRDLNFRHQDRNYGWDTEGQPSAVHISTNNCLYQCI